MSQSKTEFSVCLSSFRSPWIEDTISMNIVKRKGVQVQVHVKLVPRRQWLLSNRQASLIDVCYNSVDFWVDQGKTECSHSVFYLFTIFLKSWNSEIRYPWIGTSIPRPLSYETSHFRPDRKSGRCFVFPHSSNHYSMLQETSMYEHPNETIKHYFSVICLSLSFVSGNVLRRGEESRKLPENSCCANVIL